MKTKFFTLFAAMMLLFGAKAMAQTTGDVNEDGVVNEQDITAIIQIMQEAGGVKEQTKYYWYIGQSNPAEMTSISPIVTDNTSPGWRLIGNTKPTSSTFTKSNMLWNGVENNISFGSRSMTYIAIPYTPLQMWDDADGDGLVYNTKLNNGQPVNINGVDYYCYQADSKMAAFGFNIYNK